MILFEKITNKKSTTFFRVTLIFFISILLVQYANSQESLVANAGNDEVFCDSIGTYYLDGSATGGTPPYQYTWDITPNPIMPHPLFPEIQYHCLHYLSDSTIASPQLINISYSIEGGMNFVLTVTDSMGQTALDTVNYKLANWVVALGQVAISTFPGDTQTITIIPFAGGFPPYTIDWGTSPYIIGNQFDYNVADSIGFLSRQVIIPNGPFPLFYTITITDSEGCQFGVSSFQIFLESSSIDNEISEDVRIYPNPANQYIAFESKHQPFTNASISLMDLTGKVILYKEKLSGEQYLLSLDGLMEGVYLYKIERPDSETLIGKIIKQ